MELIVLNAGLHAGILSQQVFSMFVLEAITLTFLTTPLVSVLYPPELRTQLSDRPVIQCSEGGPESGASNPAVGTGCPWRYRFTVVLDRLEHVPGILALTQLILPTSSEARIMSCMADTVYSKKPEAVVNALRLIELSDRTSAVMKSSVAETLKNTDPVLGIFRMFGELNEATVLTSLSVVPCQDFPKMAADHAARHASQLILLSWLPPNPNPNPTHDDLTRVTAASITHSQFVQGVFEQSKSDVALFIDTGDRSGAGSSQRVFLPFFGGPDDRLALEFVLQLCLNPKTTATVVRYKRNFEITPVEKSPGDVTPTTCLPFPSATLSSCAPKVASVGESVLPR